MTIALKATKGNRNNHIKLACIFATFWLSSTALAVDFPDKGDLAAGAQAWAENCTRCHNLRAPNELRDDQWITSVFHMRVKAGLTGKETRDVLTFLQAANATTAQPRGQSEGSGAGDQKDGNSGQ